MTGTGEAVTARMGTRRNGENMKARALVGAQPCCLQEFVVWKVVCSKVFSGPGLETIPL